MIDLRNRSNRPKYLILIIISAILLIITIIICTIFTILKFNKTPSKIDPETFQAYKNANKSLYVWSHKLSSNPPAYAQLLQNKQNSFQNLLKFANFHNFSELILFSGSVEWEGEILQNGELPYEKDLVQRVKEANSQEIGVSLAFYLNDNINDMTGWETAEMIAKTVNQLSKTMQINQIYFDQEPDQVQGISTLILMLKRCNQHFPSSTSVKPLYLRLKVTDLELSEEILEDIQGNKEIETVADLINFYTEKSQVMAYSNDFGTVKSISNRMKESLQKFGRISVPIVETGFVDAEETLKDVFQADQNEFYKGIVQLAEENNGVVIHDYRQYYMNYFCVEPSDWQGVNQGRMC